MGFLAKVFGKKKDKLNEENAELQEEAAVEAAESEASDEAEELADDNILQDAVTVMEEESADSENATVEDVAQPEVNDESVAELADAEKFAEDEAVTVTVTEAEEDSDVADEPEEYADTAEEELAEDEPAEEVMPELVNNAAEDAEDTTTKKSFWNRLKSGLTKTKSALFGQVDNMLKAFVKVDEDMLEELEEILISADVGMLATETILDELRDRIKDGRLKEKDQVMDALREILTDMIGESEGLKLETTPSVILVIGVNGAGKTTSIGKISKRLKLQGKKVVVAAADTFRAAAIDQLAVWCERADVEMVRQNEGSDPAAVVFDAISAVKRKGADVLIIDTAGRLQNKKNLMNELAKIDRVIDRELPGASRETLLVLDATTGQNAVSQAKEFSNAANITGITLNKLDGTAKGGIIISIKKELNIPVKFIGVGEKIDDMQEFDADDFVRALFE